MQAIYAVKRLAGAAWLAGAAGMVVTGGALAGPGAGGRAEAGPGSAPRVSNWRASTFAPGKQVQGAIDAGPDGTIYAVWSSQRPRLGVYGQRFTADGVAVGEETALSLWEHGKQSAPAVGAIRQGGVWVVWQSHGQDGDGAAIVARRMGAGFDGSSEILINQDPAGDQSAPVVAVADDGSAAFAWMSSGDEGPPSIRVRLFDPSGRPLSDEVGIGSGSCRMPSITPAPGGGFVIAYAQFDDQERSAGVRVQRVSPRGRPVGGPTEIGGDGSKGVEPSIDRCGAGLVAAWIEAGADGNGYGVIAQRLDSTGSAAGPTIAVNQGTEGQQTGPSVCGMEGDRFAVAWNGPDGDGMGVLARVFEADGRAMTDEVVLTPGTGGDQEMSIITGGRRLAAVGAERLACAWNGKAPQTVEGGPSLPPGVDARDKLATQVSMLALDGFTGRGVAQGVTAAMGPAPAGSGAGADGAEPHRPPVFDPKRIDSSRRQIIARGEGGFDAVINTGWTPPDPHMGVGPEHIVCMTNGAIRFFLKNGQQTFGDLIEGAEGFWGEIGATDFIFDPEVVYDELSGRFFAMAAEAYAPGNKSYCLVAVSDDSDPNGTWFKYRFDTTALAGNLFDSPNIGVTDDAVIITGDGFGLGANYPVYVYDKASLLAGNPPLVKKSLTLQTSTQSAGYPPVTFGSPPAVYFIEHKEGGNNTSVRLLALTDALTNPQFQSFDLTVPAYGPPGDPPQAGTGSRVETFDARFWNVAYRNGSLWATHHVNSARALARWYEIRMNGWPKSGDNPILVQSGNIDPGPAVWTFFSAISADAKGNAAMVFARSAVDEPYTMATAWRASFDPLGQFRPAETQQAAVGPYTGGRWGDYGAVEPDPARPGRFWAIHEYAINNSWRVWIAPVDVEGCAPDLNKDGVLDLFDFLEFQNLFLEEDAAADCEANGVFDLFDFLCYQNSFVQGCE